MQHGGASGHFGGAQRFGGQHFGGAQHFGSRPAISHQGGQPAVSHFSARPGFNPHQAMGGHNPHQAIGGHANRLATGGAASRASTGAIAPSGNQGAANRANKANLDRRAIARSNAVHNAFNSREVRSALQNRAALLNPATRTAIAATAATAAWHRGSGSGAGWWRHPHGGYGWVGPVFWPFAYYDLYDYTLWGQGYDYPFWDYGYTDIYAGLFAPYSYDELTAYLPSGAIGTRTSGRGYANTVGQGGGSARAEVSDQLAQLCGEDSREVAGLPIDQIEQTIQPDEAQRQALDDLASASIKAAQDIKAACPTQIALTAPGRLAAMQTRIEAMIQAVDTVQPALQRFYDLLSDDQKARLNALAQNVRQSQPIASSLTQGCGTGQSGVADWPAEQIEARVHPTEAQRASLAALQEAAAKAADLLKSCPATEPITPPARLQALGNRLDTMLQAVTMVRGALDDFYGKLSDEQKAQFEAIGPRRSAESNQPTGTRAAPVRRRHHVSVPGLTRHLMSMARW
jgi:hypothetical protein